MMNKKIKNVAEVLINGGVVIIPTDTVFGIAAKFDNKDGISRIYNMKKRTPDKPLAILLPSIDSAWDFIKKDLYLEQEFNNSWPGATTFIVSSSRGESLGLRVPNYGPVLDIMALTGPLCATSANISGDITPARLSNVPEEIKNACDLIVDFSLKGTGIPSKIVDLRKEKKEIIRK